MKRLTLIILAVAIVAVVPGCTKADTTGDDDGSGSEQLVAGFNPPPVPTGYKRYVTPAVHQLQPGQDLILCQWIDAASVDDVDVADLKGYQTVTGHHVVLYSSAEVEP